MLEGLCPARVAFQEHSTTRQSQDMMNSLRLWALLTFSLSSLTKSAQKLAWRLDMVDALSHHHRRTKQRQTSHITHLTHHADKCAGVHLICDGGYHHWRHMVCGFKQSSSEDKTLFSCQMESVRKLSFVDDVLLYLQMINKCIRMSNAVLA